MTIHLNNGSNLPACQPYVQSVPVQLGAELAAVTCPHCLKIAGKPVVSLTFMEIE